MKLVLILLANLVLLVPAFSQVRLRVAVYHIRNPSGNLPADGNLSSRADVDDAIAEANRYLDLAGFGYRLELSVYDVLDNAMLNSTTPSWNLDPGGGANVSLIETYARTNGYGWRTDAAIVYITHSGGGGLCSYPSQNTSTIILSPYSGRPRGQLLLHEIGHFYNLGHTFDCCSCCDQSNPPNCGPSFITFGGSGLGSSGWSSDLLQDLNCNFPDNIATNKFGVGKTVAMLTPAEFELFSITYSNLMAYHDVTFRLSEIQDDVFAITANTARLNTVSGRTRFVANTGFVFGKEALSSSGVATIAEAINAASNSDVIRIHAGSYPEPQLVNRLINKPMIWVASRGPVTIGQ
jgi:hypothetical protein